MNKTTQVILKVIRKVMQVIKTGYVKVSQVVEKHKKGIKLVFYILSIISNIITLCTLPILF